MKPLFYAGYVALFIVGATFCAAALVARHVLITTLIPEWSVGFISVFIGGLVAGRSSNFLIRAAILSMSFAVAWTLILAVMPFRYVFSINAVLNEISDSRTAIATSLLWGLILASFAEAIWTIATRPRRDQLLTSGFRK